MRVYNKLVRDKIPDLIRDDNATPTTRTLSETEYLEELIKKLKEETAEFEAERSLEELADLSKVLKALADAIGESSESLEKLRQEKAEKRGGFRKRIFLEHVQ